MSKRARSSGAAIARYKDSLQKSLSCVSSTDVFLHAAPDSLDGHFRLTIANGPVTLSCGEHRLFFEASQRFSVYNDTKEFRCRTEGYVYTVSEYETLEGEIVSWHWHPPAHPRPHLHVGRSNLGHVPTGRVTFEGVARYLIEELGATPGRKNWADTLLASEALHTKYRTWSVLPTLERDQ